MYNKAILLGRLTADPELRQTPNGVSVTNFSIAVDRPFTGKDGERKVDFLNIVAWRQTAEFVCKYFSKGKPILVEGTIQTKQYTDKNGQNVNAWEIMAEQVSFTESKSNNQGGQQGQPAPQGGYQGQPAPQGGYQGQPAPQGGYQGQPAPQGGYQGQPAPQGGYQGQPAPQGGYQGQPAPQGGYQGQPAPQGGYQGQPAPQGGYQGQPAPQGGYQDSNIPDFAEIDDDGDLPF